jgi:hypothetical protein
MARLELFGTRTLALLERLEGHRGVGSRAAADFDRPWATMAAGATDLYPGYARVAREEGFEEIAEWFEMMARAEKLHRSAAAALE